MRVDHYRATVDDRPDSVQEFVFEALPEREKIWVDTKQAVMRDFYQHAVVMKDGAAVVAIVRYGGNRGGVNVELKGSVAQETYGLLRARYPGHQVSRMDVAIDRTRRGLFERTTRLMEKAVRALPANRKPYVEHKGDWTTAGRGRTLEIGKAENGGTLVIYEKGYERASKLGGVQDLNWVRAEARATPSDAEGKKALASMLPSAVWGLSWAFRTCHRVFQAAEADPVRLPKHVTSDERTYRWALEAFGPNWLRWCEEDPRFVERFTADARSMARKSRAA
jgi:DNA relaxase NicK